jgi:uncharacterized membrane protein YfhO
MKNLFFKIKDKFKEFTSKHEYLSVGIFLFVLLAIVFLPHALKNSLTIIYEGDYEFQQAYFYYEGYDAFWDFFRTGEIKLWSYESFLGVNYFAANTFYYLTSPFMIVLLFFPRMYLLQGIFITYLLKLLVGGMLFYYLLRNNFKINRLPSLVTSVAYMLSGWGMYYLWFNHFADVLAIAPLIFIAIENFLSSKKGYMLSFSIVLLIMTNYYFAFAIIIFAAFYGIIRFTKFYNFKKDYKVILDAFLFFAIGLIISSFVLVPSFLLVRELPRVSGANLLSNFLSHFLNINSNGTSFKGLIEIFKLDNITSLLNYLFVFEDRNLVNNVSGTQTLLYPIVSLFYVPINNWDSMIFNNIGFDNAQSSMFLSYSLVLVTIYGLISAFVNKNKRIIFLFTLLIFINFIPFTYYLLNGFSQIYGRWHLINVIIILIFAAQTLNNLKPKSLYMILSFIVSAGLMYFVFDYSRSIFNIGYVNQNNLLVLYSFLAILIVFLLNLVLLKFKFYNFMLVILVSLELIIASNITINGVGYSSYKSLPHARENYAELDEIFDFIKTNDRGFYRIYYDVSYNKYNMPMLFDYKGISNYHSAFNPSLTYFINDSRSSISENSWLINVIDKRINLETFLSVKYYIFEKEIINIPFGLSKIKSFPKYDLFINTNHIELGFAFDYIISENDIVLDENYFQNDLNSLNFAIIDNNDFEMYKDRLSTYNFDNTKRFKKFDLDTDRTICSDATPDNPCHLIVKLKFGGYVRARFFKEDGGLIVEDTILLNPYGIDDFRFARGYYLNYPARVLDFAFASDDQNFSGSNKESREYYYQYYADYLEYVKELKNNSLVNVEHTNNKLSFETNNSSDKMIVLSVPYDKGWNLKVNGKPSKIINANNGFIGFYAPAGLNKYSLNYFTPGLSLGIFLSALGLLLILLIYYRKLLLNRNFYIKIFNLIRKKNIVEFDKKIPTEEIGNENDSESPNI